MKCISKVYSKGVINFWEVLTMTLAKNFLIFCALIGMAKARLNWNETLSSKISKHGLGRFLEMMKQKLPRLQDLLRPEKPSRKSGFNVLFKFPFRSMKDTLLNLAPVRTNNLSKHLSHCSIMCIMKQFSVWFSWNLDLLCSRKQVDSTNTRRVSDSHIASGGH